MSREEARKLLGGYASGNLSPQEEEALLAAALDDQELFNELMAEQPVKELLDDPVARRQLLNVLEPAPQPRFVWLRKPLPWALLTGMFVLLFALVLPHWQHRSPGQATVVSELRLPPPVQVTPVQPSAIPAPLIVHRQELPKLQIPANSILEPSAPALSVLVPAQPSAAVTDNTQSAPAAVTQSEAERAQIAMERSAAPAGVIGGVPSGTAPGPMRFDQAAPGFSALRSAAKTGLPLRVSLQRLTPSGEYALHDVSAPLPATHPARLRIVTSAPGYVYVLQTSPAPAHTLFASDRNPLAPNAELFVPLTPSPGEMRLVLVTSPTPLSAQTLETQASNPNAQTLNIKVE